MKSLPTAILVAVATLSPALGADLTDYIDPRIGNVSMLLVPTFPTFSLPNQMLRMVPAKNNYIEDQVSGFPLQVGGHRMAGIVPMKVVLGPLTAESWKRKMTIDHDLDVVRPWHYSTYLIDDDIRVSFTPAKRAAIYQVDFPVTTADRNLLFSGSANLKISSPGANAFALEDQFSFDNKGLKTITLTQTVYAYGEITDPEGRPIAGLRFDPAPRGFSFTLPVAAAATVLIKYGISYISPAQAMKNYRAEAATAKFADLVTQGHAAWAKVTDQLVVEGGTEAQKRSFYTALYRTHERMVDVNEGGQYFSGYDQKVHQSDRPFYVDDWIWDTYLATHPLRTLIDPQLESDILNSYTLMYEQSGWLPTFPQIFGNRMCMNGYHSSALFLDAHRKGITGFDLDRAYAGIKKNLTEGSLLPWRQGNPRGPLDDFFYAQGFFPALRPGQQETDPMVDGFEKRQAVAVTLGIAFDAWTLAQLAQDLGRAEDFQTFSRVAEFYRNLWHPGERLFMPKDEKGEWIMIDPKSAGGPGYREFYDENNGWTYAWQVQHDIAGLVGLLGGKKATEERLDQLFREPLGMGRNHFYVNGANSTGLVGQFSMGNEPSFHIPYLYNYVGAPWKTQQRTRFLLDVWFQDTIFGMPGDEDGGGMSGFVILSSIGLYQVTPGLPVFTITSPVFERTTIRLTGGKTFTIVAKGASKERKYIQKAALNGQPLDTPFITYATVMAGGTLTLDLAEKPNKDWGKDAVIPQ
ncbi:MAG: GH92 family glycosyl hydrolase [Lacunisphaera sp.]|nr:GH92 family glycosyl hydrolase [Lacunisphaera sp.]